MSSVSIPFGAKVASEPIKVLPSNLLYSSELQQNTNWKEPSMMATKDTYQKWTDDNDY